MELFEQKIRSHVHLPIDDLSHWGSLHIRVEREGKGALQEGLDFLSDGIILVRRLLDDEQGLEHMQSTTNEMAL